MTPENTQKLLAAYPQLYRDLRNQSVECGDGWFDLVWQMSAEIEATATHEGISKTSKALPSICILKQKFGTLRVQFHVDVSDAMETIAAKVHEQSQGLCELCGAPAHYDNDQKLGRWVETLCDECRKAHRSPLRSQGSNKLPVWMREKDEN